MNRGWHWSSRKCRCTYAKVITVFTMYTKKIMQEVESLFHKLLHSIAVWIHRYLHGRRVSAPIRDEDVSTHLKNVLEYKKEARPPTEAEVSAENVK